MKISLMTAMIIQAMETTVAEIKRMKLEPTSSTPPEARS